MNVMVVSKRKRRIGIKKEEMIGVGKRRCQQKHRTGSVAYNRRSVLCERLDVIIKEAKKNINIVEAV
jgi:hypothetical protein